MSVAPFSFFRLYLPIALLVLAGAAFYSNQAIEHELTQIRNQESAYIKLGAGALSNKIGFVSHDLVFLSRHTALRAAIEQPTQKNLAHLAEDFSIFSASLGHYDQIRWIDQHGMERVRVDYVQGKAVVIPAEKLQNKGQRYYFTDTFKLKPNEIFVSPLDLNIEQNSIEVPYKPMLRVATPVFDQHGNKRGIVILNYFGKELLTAYSDATATIADHSMIINGEGYWLKSPNPDDEWGFMFKRPELSMKARAPFAWEHISNTETGQLELEDGLWTWETVHPLQVSEKSSTGAADAFTPSSGEVEARQYSWKSVAHFPKSSLNSIRHELWIKVVSISGILLILFGLVIWLLVRSWQTLAAEKLKFSTVANFAYDWETWLDSNGRYLYCSPSCERITGWPAEAFMADPNLLLNICHPDDHARLKSHLQLHQASDPPCEFDFRIVLPDGKIRWLEHACQSVFGNSGEFLGRRASNRDITERQLSDEKVRYSEQRFRDVSNAAGEYLWEIDTNMRYTYVSNRSSSVKGYSPDELLGHTPMEFMHPDDIAGVGEIVNRAIADKAPFHLQHRDISKSGAIVWEEVNGTPFFDSQGNVIGLRGAGLNITERKEREDQNNWLAFYDPLTRLPNRRLLSERLSQAIVNSKRTGLYGALMFLDLDNFKPLNDKHGHAVGDLMLIEAANRIKSCVREVDTVARFGGDEFVVELDGMNADGEEAISQSLIIAEKIRSCLSEPYLLSVANEDTGETVVEHHSSASIGVTVFGKDAVSQEEVMKQADAEMYNAKNSGRNFISIYGKRSH